MFLGTVHIFALSDSITQGSSASAQSAGAISGGNGAAVGGYSGSTATGANATGDGFGVENSGAGAESQGTPQSSNKSLGGLSFLRGVLPPAMIPKYAASEWSFAQVFILW